MLMTLDTVKLIEWVKTEFGDETATKLQEKLPEFEAPKEEPKSEEPKPEEPPTPPAENFSEADNKEKIALRNRIAVLEAENRLSKFSEFVGTTNVPAGLKLTAVNALEVAHSAETSNFSVKDEKGAVATPTAVVKSLLNSWPQTVQLGADGEVINDNFSEPGLQEEIESAAKSFNQKRNK